MKIISARLLISTLGLLASMSNAAPPAVVLAGVLGSKALLVVNGASPKSVAAGETHQGVKVLSVGKDEAVVEIEGIRRALRLGEAPVSIGNKNSGKRVVLAVDGNGHFVDLGTINGKSIKYMVDTGASTVAIGRADADRIGLKYLTGQPIRMWTANGMGQAWRVKLDSLGIGDIQVQGVEAVVTSEPMPYILLGNSFLKGFQMTRTNDQMVLEKQP
jgi:aspartyl protease family protein